MYSEGGNNVCKKWSIDQKNKKNMNYKTCDDIYSSLTYWISSFYPSNF